MIFLKKGLKKDGIFSVQGECIHSFTQQNFSPYYEPDIILDNRI